MALEPRQYARLLSVGIKYSMGDLVCDVINYFDANFYLVNIKCIYSNRNWISNKLSRECPFKRWL